MLDVDSLALLGGHVALDFVNTVEDRASRHPEDVLKTPDDLCRWATRVGIADVAIWSASGSSSDEFMHALQLRESVHAALKAFSEGSVPPREAMRTISETNAEASAHRRLIGGPPSLTWAWNRSCLENVRYEVALAAAHLLTDPNRMARTHLCAAEGCGWFFLDRSKNGSRRWCSMRGCGAEEKAKRRAGKRASS